MDQGLDRGKTVREDMNRQVDTAEQATPNGAAVPATTLHRRDNNKMKKGVSTTATAAGAAEVTKNEAPKMGEAKMPNAEAAEGSKPTNGRKTEMEVLGELNTKETDTGVGMVGGDTEMWEEGSALKEVAAVWDEEEEGDTLTRIESGNLKQSGISRECSEESGQSKLETHMNRSLVKRFGQKRTLETHREEAGGKSAKEEESAEEEEPEERGETQSAVMEEAATEEADHGKVGKKSSEGFEKGPGTREEIGGKPTRVDWASQQLAAHEGKQDQRGGNPEQNMGRTAGTPERRMWGKGRRWEEVDLGGGAVC